MGSTHNRDLMKMARENLEGRWGICVGGTLLYLIVSWFLSLGVGFLLGHIVHPRAEYAASLLTSGPLTVGPYLFFLTVARRSDPSLGQLFAGFSSWRLLFISTAAYVLVLVFICLWMLLLIVPGLIASYAYLMTFFIIADDPEIGPLVAIGRSKEMMKGNKWKLFCLFWRFFGWALLCILTCGIGFLWLGPYLTTTMALFYEDVRPQ